MKIKENRKSNRPRRLKSSEVQELLSVFENVQDSELTQVGAGEARLLSDGRVLFRFEDGKGIIYETRDQVIDMLRRVEKKASLPPRHPAHELLPQGEVFPTHIPDLLRAFPQILGISSVSLDRTEESLDLVEEVIRRRGARTFLAPNRFPALVAYIGEVIRQSTIGTWQMHHDPHSNAWEPVIVDPNGRIFQPFAIVYQELQKGGRGSIRGAVNGALRYHLLSGDQTKPK